MLSLAPVSFFSAWPVISNKSFVPETSAEQAVFFLPVAEAGHASKLQTFGDCLFQGLFGDHSCRLSFRVSSLVYQLADGLYFLGRAHFSDPLGSVFLDLFHREKIAFPVFHREVNGIKALQDLFYLIQFPLELAPVHKRLQL